MDSLNKNSEALLSFQKWLGWAVVPPHSLLSRLADAVQLRRIAPGANSFGVPLLSPETDHIFWDVAKTMGLTPRAFWPRSAPYALCITHDMDRVLATWQRFKRHVRHPHRALKYLITDLSTSGNRKKWEENAYFNFQRMANHQQQNNYRSALYVLFEKRRWRKAFELREPQHAIGVYQPDWIEREIRQFYEIGNEIGIHGSFDSYDDPEALKQEIDSLFGFGINQVKGVRNHYLNYDVTFTPAAQRQTGILYDSTLGFNFRSGFRVGTAFPYWNKGLWELPFQLMDSALFYESKQSVERAATVRKVLDAVSEVHGTLVMNWHTHVMNPEVFSEHLELLSYVIQCAKKDGAWITRPVDLVTHWQQREWLVRLDYCGISAGEVT